MKPLIYPHPVHMTWSAQIGRHQVITLHDPFGKWHSVKSEENEQGQIDVDLYLAVCPEGFDHSKQHLVHPEGYYIEINKQNTKKATVWITAISDQGYYYAYLTWQQIIQNPLYEGSILDYPLMRIRGIVEGYYGKPWTMEERKRAISILSSEKMNTYVYAPKNDPYHRDAWRIPYPKVEVENLQELIQHCRSYNVDFVFAVSPGLSIQYSSPEHLDRLMDKYEQIYLLGVRSFGLFLDDIPSMLIHDRDQKEYPSLQTAHASFIHRVFCRLKELDPVNQLMVCPTQYFGRGDESYIMELGQSLHKDIFVMWTGRSICSPEIHAREARLFYEHTSHQPLYWDNYPVNDANMRDEMHIGPIIQRDPALYLYTSGMIFNVMEYAEASLIPLVTCSHYLWNPPKYSSDDSFLYSAAKITGEEIADSFLQISDCINQSSLSPLPGDRFMQSWFAHAADPGRDFKTVILDYLAKTDLLMNMKNTKLKKELTPWLEQLKRDLHFLLDIFSGSKNGQELSETIRNKYENQAKALGFFPYLIANETLNKHKSDDPE